MVPALPLPTTEAPLRFKVAEDEAERLKLLTGADTAALLLAAEAAPPRPTLATVLLSGADCLLDARPVFMVTSAG